MLTTCNLAEITTFVGTYCLYLQSRVVSYTRKCGYGYTEMKGIITVGWLGQTLEWKRCNKYVWRGNRLFLRMRK
jgi:hypothetical protein